MTAHGSGDLQVSEERRFQFSLRGLMVLMFGVACGLSVVSLEKGNWAGGLLAAVSIWIILGLISQVRDLFRAFYGRSDLSGDERWGWRFAAFWRTAAASLLLGHHVVNLLLERGLLVLSEFPEAMFDVDTDLRDALLYLTLLIVLFSVPQSPPKRSASWRSRLLNIGGVFIAIVLCLLVWSNRWFLEYAFFWLLVLMVLASVLRSAPAQPRSPWRRVLGVVGGIVGGIGAVVCCLCFWSSQTLIYYLVHVALLGIENTLAPPFAIEGVSPDTVARSQAFFWRSLIAAGFVLVNLALIHQLAGQWTRGFRRRLIWAGLLLPSLAITTAYPVWLYTSGLRSASPFMADALEIGPLHRWVYALLVVIVLATAATYRIVHNSDESTQGPEANWRRNPRSYYHERRPLIMLLVVATIVACIADLVSRRWIIYPTAYLIAAGFLLALQKSFWAGYRPLNSQPAHPPRLPLPRFCAIWSAMFLTAVFGMPTLAWFSFAVWLSPWYQLPWP